MSFDILSSTTCGQVKPERYFLLLGAKRKCGMFGILFKIDFSYLFCPWHILLSTHVFTGLMSTSTTT